MILGASHISLSSFNIDDDIKRYKKKGFSLTFLDKGIENNPEKKSYLNQYKPLHSIAVLSGRSGLNIELVEHYSEKPLNTNLNLDFDLIDAKVEIIKLKTTDVDESLEFWKNFMGFTEILSDKNPVVLEKKSIIPNWQCKVQFVKTDQIIHTPKLDFAGATALAFYTTNLEKTMEQFAQNYEFPCSNIFQLEVNNKPLEIAFISGPSKEIIELIQIK